MPNFVEAIRYKPKARLCDTAQARAMQRISGLINAPLNTTLDEIKLIRDGVSPALLEALKQLGMNPSEYSWIVNPRTLAHRKQRQEPLTQEESGRWLRAMRLCALAIEVFGNNDKALAWLRKPRSLFGGQSALSVMQTEPGASLVEEALNQIDSGYFE